MPGTPSYQQNAEGYFLTSGDMVWFWNHYLNSEADAANPHACPLRAASLAGLPPALVITAEFDPLRDEGEMYAARLRESGVAAELVRYDGMIHGFFSMAGVLDQGRSAHFNLNVGSPSRTHVRRMSMSEISLFARRIASPSVGDCLKILALNIERYNA